MFEGRATVVILCTEGEAYAENAARSVKSQTHPNPQLIFADIQTQPRYSNLIRRLVRNYNGEVVFVAHLLQLGEIFNKIEAPYVAFLKDTDAFTPAKLSVSLARLEREKRAFAITGCTTFNRVEAPASAAAQANDWAEFLADCLSNRSLVSWSAVVSQTDFARRRLVGNPTLGPEFARIANQLAFITAFGLIIPEALTLVRTPASPPQSDEDVYADELQVAVAFANVLRNLRDSSLIAFLMRYADITLQPGAGVCEHLVEAAVRLAEKSALGRLEAVSCLEAAFQRFGSAVAPVVSGYDFFLVDRLRFEIVRDARMRYESQRDRLLNSQNSPVAHEKSEAGAFFLFKRPARPSKKKNETNLFYEGSSLEIGRRILLSSIEASNYLISGFSVAEPWGRWTDGFTARIEVYSKDPHPDLWLKIWPRFVFDSGTDLTCRIGISVNGEAKRPYVVVPDEPIIHCISSGEGLLSVRIDITHPKMAHQEPREDSRRLGIGIEAFSFEEVSK